MLKPGIIGITDRMYRYKVNPCGSMVAKGRCGGFWEAWWLNGHVPDCCPAVPGSNPASTQPTADSRSPGGLPLGMALVCGLSFVRGSRGEN
jgi:hypothetical protein